MSYDQKRKLKKKDLTMKKNALILFQGDSLTDGGRVRDGDPNHALGQGYVFAVASRWGADAPEAELNFVNRGNGGDTLLNMASRWNKDVLDLKPDLLSILIGVNDAGHETGAWPEPRRFTSVLEYDRLLRVLLQKARSRNPDLLLILGIPVVYPGMRTRGQVPAWSQNCAERGKILRNIAEDFGAIIVDYPRVFQAAQKRAPISYWFWDGIHPTSSGHGLMASAWYDAIQKMKFYKNS